MRSSIFPYANARLLRAFGGVGTAPRGRPRGVCPLVATCDDAEGSVPRFPFQKKECAVGGDDGAFW